MCSQVYSISKRAIVLPSLQHIQKAIRYVPKFTAYNQESYCVFKFTAQTTRYPSLQNNLESYCVCVPKFRAWLRNILCNCRGQTALHKAAAHKRRAVCCLLVAGGASPLRQDLRGHTPRHLALLANDQHLAAYLESEFKSSKLIVIENGSLTVPSQYRTVTK